MHRSVKLANRPKRKTQAERRSTEDPQFVPHFLLSERLLLLEQLN
uniref:Uncharacterized protein n=1 Tax=Anguilla anguilla TaxID=7936 RepID=A0A0E9XVI2_ANGAN